MTATFDDLHHLDHRVRLQAVARAAAQLGPSPEALVSVLGPMLDDPYPGVRAASALRLGDAAATHDAALDALKAASTEGAPVARRLAGLLGLGRAALVTPEPEGARLDPARRLAHLALEDEDPDVRFQGLTALTRLGLDARASLAPLRASLGDDDQEVAAVAAELLADHGDTEAIEPLRRRLEVLRGHARRVGLLSLGRLLAGRAARESASFEQARAQVVEGLLKDVGKLPWGLRACEVLGLLGDARVAPRLAALAESWFTNRFIKVAAASALVRLGDARGAKLLVNHASSRRRDQRGFALEQIGALGLVELRETLVAVLRDGGDYHSDTAALALGRLGDDPSLEALTRALSDPRPEVRAEAARALHLHRPQDPALVRLAAEDPDAEVREAAAGLSDHLR